MKAAVIVLGLSLVLLAGCQSPVNIEKETTAIQKVLDNYIVSIEKEDLDLYGQIMSHDPEMVNFGTSEEPIVGWESLRKVIADQNDALAQTKISARDVKVHLSPSGDFAWATSLWNFKAMMGDKLLDLPVRCSWILERQKGGWVIVHFHKSMKVE